MLSCILGVVYKTEGFGGGRAKVEEKGPAAFFDKGLVAADGLCAVVDCDGGQSIACNNVSVCGKEDKKGGLKSVFFYDKCSLRI